MPTHLPVVGSTAATTAFAHARIDGLGGTTLIIDGNGKITAGNGTLLAPKPNAFSLPAAGLSGLEHCPQSTPTCRKACYVEGLNRAQPELYAAYQENAKNIREILADRQLANDWAMRFAHWVTVNAPGGFRWHVSGDVFLLEYAQWIADVCREAPSVRFWIYTRSFEFLGPLAEVSTLRGENLAVNLSCDQDNYWDAKEASIAYGGLRRCYLAVEGEEGSPVLGDDDVIFPDYSLRPRQFATLAESPWWDDLSKRARGLVCPVDAHGKAENRRCGPCSRCLT